MSRELPMADAPWRVVWAWGVGEDYPTLEEARARAEELAARPTHDPALRQVALLDRTRNLRGEPRADGEWNGLYHLQEWERPLERRR
jgi:hypothetical protein